MPYGRDKTEKPKYERLKVDNKVPIEGTRLFEIRDVWFYNVREVEMDGPNGKWKKRQYCGDPTKDQNCQIKLSPEGRPDIVLGHDFYAYVSAKSAFAKFLKSVLGIEPGDDLYDYLTPEDGPDAKWTSRKLRDDLNGKKVLGTTELKSSGYIKFTELRAPIKETNDDLAAIPLKSNPQLQAEPLTEAQKASEEYEDKPKGDKRFPFKAAKLPEEKLSGSIFEPFDGDDLEPPPPNPEPAYAQGLEEDVQF